MAEVDQATQMSRGREVAVKVLLRKEDAAFTERFIQEGHIVASLRHPAIITIHDIGQIADGRHYLAMEYLGGGDLAQPRGLVFSPSRALDIIRQLARARSEARRVGKGGGRRVRYRGSPERYKNKSIKITKN